MHFEGRPVILYFMIRIWCAARLQSVQINRHAFQQITKQSVILSFPQKYVKLYLWHSTSLYTFIRIFPFYIPLESRPARQLHSKPWHKPSLNLKFFIAAPDEFVLYNDYRCLFLFLSLTELFVVKMAAAFTAF